MAKKYIPFFESYYDAAQELNRVDRMKLYDAIITYGFTGEAPELKGKPLLCWKLIKPYLEKSIKDRENGANGGRPKKEKKTTVNDTKSDKTETPVLEKDKTPVLENTETLKKKKKEKEEEKEEEDIKETVVVSKDTTTKKKSTPKPKPDYFKELAGNDSELLETLKAFNEMRTKIKKPMTETAKKMLCEKLNKNFQPCEWVAILNQSIYHGWQDVYELKDDAPQTGYQQTQTSSTLDEQFARVAEAMGVDW